MAPKWSKLQRSLCDQIEQEELLIMLVAYYITKRKKTVKRKHRWWTHSIIQKRHEQGAYHNLVMELQLDGDKFQQYFRLSREQFAQIMFHVEADLVKRSRCREVISPRQRLAVCLRFLASGETFRSLAFSYRIGATTIGNIVSEVCQLLWKKLAPIYMTLPNDSYDWELIAANFQSKWQFPHCLGALDGKHVVMKAPWNSGSQYYNYKGTFSTVFLALVDANLKFIAIDVGAYGRNSDGGILSHSNLGKAIARNTLNFSSDAPMLQAEHLGNVPYVIIADEAFPLQKHIMRPFPGKRCTLEQQTYNYRLSRARRIVENAFGILAARWRVYHTKLCVRPVLVTDIVKATCVLHNMLQTQSTPAQVTTLMQEAEGVDHEGLQPLVGTGNRAGEDAMDIRNVFMQYLYNFAPVSWQNEHVRRGIFTE